MKLTSVSRVTINILKGVVLYRKANISIIKEKSSPRQCFQLQQAAIFNDSNLCKNFFIPSPVFRFTAASVKYDVFCTVEFLQEQDISKKTIRFCV